MMTQSNASRASCEQPAHAVGRQTGHRIGDRAARPAAPSGVGDTCEQRQLAVARRCAAPSLKPAQRSGPGTPSCSDGRRRSASMSSTLPLVRLAERQREVGRRQRLAFARHRARRPSRPSMPLLGLRVVEPAASRRYCSREAAIVCSIDDQLLGQRRRSGSKTRFESTVAVARERRRRGRTSVARADRSPGARLAAPRSAISTGYRLASSGHARRRRSVAVGSTVTGVDRFRRPRCRARRRCFVDSRHDA